MHIDTASDIPWVVFRLEDNQFALPASKVQEMIALPDVTPMPNAPPYLRGVINLRGNAMPLLDLRLRLGLDSASQVLGEFMEMLGAREQDHKKWVAELESSVSDNRPFTLTTDPHQCAFGKWFDSFDTENFELLGIIHKFDRPHRRIHATGDEVAELVAGGNQDKAMALIKRTRDGSMAQMVELFAEVRLAVKITQREIALVLDHQGRNVALAVDGVESVENIDPDTIEDARNALAGGTESFVAQVGRRGDNGEMIMILDMGLLLGEGIRLGTDA